MKFLPVIALTVSAVITAEAAGLSGTKGGSSKLQFGTRTSPLKSGALTASPSNYGDFRGTLRQKAKLLLKEETSTQLPFYSENATRASMPETFANIELESVHLMPENRSQISDEMFHKMLGTETTSMMPLIYEDDTELIPAPKLNLKSKSKGKSAKLQQEKEIYSNVVEVPNTTDSPFGIFQQLRDNHFVYGDDFQQGQEKESDNLEVEEVDGQPEGKKREIVKAAVHQIKRTIEVRPVEFENLEENKEPQVIEVDAKGIPLEIHFKSSSSPIKLRQMHQPIGEIAEIEHTQSTEEPQRLRHVVHKPIIQEVREIITPYRRIVQQIEPVVEEIHTIVPQSREKEIAKEASGSGETETIGEFERQKQAKNDEELAYTAQLKEKDQINEWKPVKGQAQKIQFVANPQHYYQQAQLQFQQQQAQNLKQLAYGYSEFSDNFAPTTTPQPEVRPVFHVPSQQPEPEVGFEVADFDGNEIAQARVQQQAQQLRLPAVRKMQLPVVQSNARVLQKNFVPSRQEVRPAARIVQVSGGIKGRQSNQASQGQSQFQNSFQNQQSARVQQQHRQVTYSPIAEASTRSWNQHNIHNHHNARQQQPQQIYSWSSLPVRSVQQLQY